jgi:hypothetical protein
MIVYCTKLLNEHDELVGCVTLKVLNEGQTFEPAAPFPPGVEDQHNELVRVKMKAWTKK